MSHIVQLKTEIRDANALGAACQRLGLDAPAHETTRLFSGESTGHVVRLADWRYPVVCDLGTGELQFDNYGGKWGDQKHLDRLLQTYAVEKAKVEARRRGHGVTEKSLADGSIKLTISVGSNA
jgi:hypothetical protein